MAKRGLLVHGCDVVGRARFAASSSCGPARHLRAPHRIAGDAIDGGARSVRAPHRHRAAAQEPSRRAGSSARGRLPLRAARMAVRGARSGRALAATSVHRGDGFEVGGRAATGGLLVVRGRTFARTAVAETMLSAWPSGRPAPVAALLIIESVRPERRVHVFMDASWTRSLLPCEGARPFGR